MRKVALLMLLIGIASPVFGHSGGTDANGCHTNKKTGEYHCHNPKTPVKQTTPQQTPAPPKQTSAPQTPPPQRTGPTTAKGNTSNDSFNKAKQTLEDKVYFDHRTTFYCDNPFDSSKNVIPSAKYTPKNASSRSARIEWEHIVPAHAFGQAFSEWRNGHPSCVDNKGKPFSGRSCAEKVNMQFRYMQADMHNLVPAIGEINGLRSNYSFAMISGEKREFGACDMEIEDGKAEPKPDIRGDIARIYFYMNSVYPGRGIISDKNVKLFEAWSKEDPVSAWECTRNQRIKAVQGNDNPFVSQYCR